MSLRAMAPALCSKAPSKDVEREEELREHVPKVERRVDGLERFEVDIDLWTVFGSAFPFSGEV